MSELIPCPFCGWEFAEHAWNEFGEEYRVCDQCGASSGTVDSKWDWQSRPIEDALRKRVAELEAERIEWVFEDQLPDGIPDAVYSAMYACSEVDFVRVFPSVTVDGRKRFLIELPEAQQ